ncbi:hypothetical protein [Cellulomonas carbonis]|uniref:Cell division protein FtsL n=1 Tax=Cellulomonas carbonis T26 TaxID=947969 RepID=A0A0A0BVV4_9CELL|nr:hypothetical protein [Cellulomonas carbonis]KGM12110.1 hypothetical protein N868_01680 [Cellulomonas carbonis T26]GGB97089.1 hypothetical protein GCM10010972_07310 [Cellulomonas carbonis]
MSAVAAARTRPVGTAQAAPLRSPAAPAPQPAPRPRLRVVAPPAHARTRTPFVVLCMGLLGAALLGTLLLNTSMAQGEYDRFALQRDLAQSAQEQQRLLTELEHVSSPAQIADAAQRLGMVPSTGGGYLRLSDGAVLGNPTPAGG